MVKVKNAHHRTIDWDIISNISRKRAQRIISVETGLNARGREFGNLVALVLETRTEQTVTRYSVRAAIDNLKGFKFINTDWLAAQTRLGERELVLALEEIAAESGDVRNLTRTVRGGRNRSGIDMYVLRTGVDLPSVAQKISDYVSSAELQGRYYPEFYVDSVLVERGVSRGSEMGLALKRQVLAQGDNLYGKADIDTFEKKTKGYILLDLRRLAKGADIWASHGIDASFEELKKESESLGSPLLPVEGKNKTFYFIRQGPEHYRALGHRLNSSSAQNAMAVRTA